MPEISLNIPSNSRFHSSLNEIDIAFGRIMLSQMRIADPRSILGQQDISATESENNWLWDESRIFQVDELDIEEIFDTYLLRKKINNQNNVDVSYPLLAYKQNDIETVFWGTGNRYKQWYFDIPVETDDWEVGDTVVIVSPLKFRGSTAEIIQIKTDSNNSLTFKLSLNGSVVKDPTDITGKTVLWFTTDDIRPTGDKIPNQYKAKAITGTYTTAILCDNRDEIQYLRDHFILRCADANIWFKYASPTINNSENQIFTVFGIPNIDKVPTSLDKLKGHGYIYSMAFTTNIWACLTDTPLPQGYIDTIRMNLHVENVNNTTRIVIT